MKDQLTDFQIKAQSDSIQVDILNAEIIRLREQLINLRFNGTKPGPGHDDLRNFLDSVADIVAAHPFAQTAPTYFAVTLQRARERVE